MGTVDKYIQKGGNRSENDGEVLCGSGTSGATVGVIYMIPDSRVGEGPRGVSPPGGSENGRHGPQTSAGK